MVEKLLQDPFLWNQNWVFLWTNDLRFSTVYLYCMPSWGRYLAILKPSSRPLAFTTYEAFLKNKKRSGTSMTASFSAWLLKKKHFSYCILLPDQISLSSCLHLVRYWAICVWWLFVNLLDFAWSSYLWPFIFPL